MDDNDTERISARLLHVEEAANAGCRSAEPRRDELIANGQLHAIRFGGRRGSAVARSTASSAASIAASPTAAQRPASQQQRESADAIRPGTTRSCITATSAASGGRPTWARKAHREKPASSWPPDGPLARVDHSWHPCQRQA
jgi:hypothetical protein